MRVIYFLAAFFSAIGVPVCAQESDKIWLSFEPEIVVLEGLLEEKEFYGPPNFGGSPETDQVEMALILAPFAPVSVRRSDNDPLNGDDVENVIRVQLVCGRERNDCPRFANKKVRVTGSLFSAHTAHHRAKILMTVSEISEIK